MRTSILLVASCLLLVAACGDSSTADAGPDASRADSGSDLGTDAGSPDLGADAGSPDLGTDAGSPDLGTDAGSPDLGADAGSPDLGTDATTPDASADMSTGDAGANPIIEACMIRVDGVNGCSAACSSAGSAATSPGGACYAQAGALVGDADLMAFTTCGSTCPAGRVCSSGETITDCDCGTACVRAQSTRFQALFEDLASCIATATRAACE